METRKCEIQELSDDNRGFVEKPLTRCEFHKWFDKIENGYSRQMAIVEFDNGEVKMIDFQHYKIRFLSSVEYTNEIIDKMF